MAVKVSTDRAGKEWTKFTGDDLPKAKGLLTEAGNLAYREAFHKNEGEYERITDPHGNPTQVRKRDVENALAQGYGKSAIAPSMVVPDLPWQKNHVPRIGKHKYRYDKATGSMVEVG
jgi:hypothetical protein